MFGGCSLPGPGPKPWNMRYRSGQPPIHESFQWKIIEAELSCSAGEFSFSSRPLLKCIWLVVWNIWIIFPIILGMSSSQLTFTPSFFRGVGIPPTSYDFMINFIYCQNIKGQVSTPKCPNVPGRSDCSRPVPFELRLSWYLLQRFRPAQLGGSWADGCREMAEIVRYIMLNLYI